MEDPVSSASASQASAGGDISDGHLEARAGAAHFAIGSDDGRADIPIATPYDLLSASLAACTAMTLRWIARRRKYPLSHVDVVVSYQHGTGGARDSFERIIALAGNLSDHEKENLVHAATYCPVSQTLGAIAEIRTRLDSDVSQNGLTGVAVYENDLNDLSIPNIDPD
jgi:putative redox protein